MNTQSDKRLKLAQLIGESVLDALLKAGVRLEIPSESEKFSYSLNLQNEEELDLLRQRILEQRLSLISELSQMYHDEPKRRSRSMI